MQGKMKLYLPREPVFFTYPGKSFNLYIPYKIRYTDSVYILIKSVPEKGTTEIDMSNKQWYDYGKKLGDMIQDAVEQNDFSNLSSKVADTIDEATNQLGEALRNGDLSHTVYRAAGKAFDQAMEAADRALSGQGRQADHSPKGIIKMVVGWCGAVSSGFFALMMGLAGVFMPEPVGVIVGIIALIITVFFARMAKRGREFRDRQRRQQKYLDVSGKRDVVTVKELAAATGKSESFVSDDLQTMIEQGMFHMTVYMDTERTALMFTRQAYDQYLATIRDYETRRRAEEEQRASEEQQKTARAEQKAAKAVYDEETKQALSEGREFIRHIHECNAAIPEEVFTEKLNRLERTVTRIFDQIERDPSSAPDLHRMMNYYLPITRKLIDAYRSMEEAGSTGRNTSESKREISKSLDTINVAFENMLDEFFADTAFDISTDISTLNTMLARDGLTGKDFQPGKIKTVAKDVVPDQKKPVLEMPQQQGWTDGYTDDLSAGGAMAQKEEQ